MSSPNTKRKEAQSSNDLFITPQEALDAIEPYIDRDINAATIVLDPCSGLGDISYWLHKNFGRYLPSLNINANELYPCEDESKLLWKPEYTQDFLDENNTVPTADVICANPPYNRAMEFVLQGFDYAPVQWHFLRLSFLEGKDRFNNLFNLGKLSDVYIFTYRVSCDKGYDREPTANSVCYAWYRFDKNYYGQPKLHWLTKGGK